MLKKDDLEKFLDEAVSVGVPHSIIEGRLFYYYGKLSNVSEGEIKLETNNGIRLISVEDIIDIHFDRRRF
jgi:hypothetical protein